MRAILLYKILKTKNNEIVFRSAIQLMNSNHFIIKHSHIHTYINEKLYRRMTAVINTYIVVSNLQIIIMLPKCQCRLGDIDGDGGSLLHICIYRMALVTV